jgi:hypothetical protein
MNRTTFRLRRPARAAVVRPAARAWLSAGAHHFLDRVAV